MRKKIIGVLFGIAIFSSIQIKPSYADTGKFQGAVIVNDDRDDSTLLPEGTRHSRDVKYNKFKGSIISSASTDITNEGGGDIGILLETLAHVPCDRIRQVAYLEYWDEKSEDWLQMQTFIFEETKEDHPDKDFTGLMNGFTVLDCPTGYYYRVRAMHGVWKGEEGEAFNTRTDGVLATK